ncbi:eIF-2-alpha kinase GCN2 [Caerostris extrusa]|uniref:EIF-2-alpha kinase GCN2 n=1 Tax=Caerostris extrusa TaxID=172846 RepID=A0AAV4PEY2_CAEEX|nr:eIF-2-alpha kinase GCN2 [Caerostris extrusa]
MSTNQDLKERQENELISISSIFPNEMKDLRNSVWNIWKPLEMSITVYPEESMTDGRDSNLHVDLYIKCSATYPKTSPFIDLRNPKGISNENLSTLKKLTNKAKELVGSEVILELVHLSREFLYNHKNLSFNLSMKRWNPIRPKNSVKKQRGCKSTNWSSKKWRKKLTLHPLVAEHPTRKGSVSRRRSRSTSTGKELCSESELQAECKEMLNCKLKFEGKKEFTIVCGRCLGHSDRGCITYSGMDNFTGNLVVVIKWTLQFNVSHKLKGEEWEALQKEQAAYRKNLEAIEQEFKALRQINSKHLAHYLGMTYISKKDKIVIYVLQEFISGSTLSQMCDTLHLTVPQIQHYTREILKL